MSVRRHRIKKYYQHQPKPMLVMKHESCEDIEASRNRRRRQMFNKEKLGWHMEAKGGTTEVTITSPEGFMGLTDEVTVQGKSVCMDIDFFNKKEGRNRALGKAIAEFKAATGVTITSTLLKRFKDNELRAKRSRIQQADEVIERIRGQRPPAHMPGGDNGRIPSPWISPLSREANERSDRDPAPAGTEY